MKKMLQIVAINTQNGATGHAQVPSLDEDKTRAARVYYIAEI
jgi:hypothetical protein